MKLQKREISFGAEKSQRNSKSGMTAWAVGIAYIIGLGIRIPLSRVIGDAGVGLFAPAFELFSLTALLFSYGISRTMTGLIRYRMKREQYKSARKVFHMALKLSVLLSILLALILVLTCGFFSETVILEAMCRKAVLAVAPSIILTALVNVLRGYFNGNGFGILVAHSHYIEKIAMLLATVFGGRFAYEGYGIKAAALYQNDTIAYAYGALGAAFGILLSQLVTLIYLLFVFGIYSGTWKRQFMQDNGRRLETNGELMGMLAGNSIPVALAAVLANVFMLIDQRFFNYCMNRTGQEARTQLWGSYYGKFAALTGIGAAIVCLAVQNHIGRAAASYEREEYRLMRDRIGSAVKKLCITAFPVAIILAVLAEAFIKGLYKGESEMAISMLRRGTVVIFFYGLAFLFGQLMIKMRMMIELLISLAVSLALHILAVFIFVKKMLLGAEGIVYSLMIFTAVLAVACFLFVCRKVQYRQEWLYSFAFPAAAACVAGLLVMLLDRLLYETVGAVATILISCIVSAFLYILLLIILRVVNAEEVSEFPFSGIWIAIGRMIGVF
ncbi:MAG: polysaccharide biosynthesis C-terminal domain-containing protein [Roseburia sp.]|nr:polysaccharide biosynthesis C-terminal domain-containing protein [Roseburia sp.]MCM1243805.1 polysaccharide biosynthesis C-terminal domain-containing protein [Roseburia sp.]